MRLARWMVLFAGLTALIAGCGGDDDSGGTTTAAAQATTQATTPTTTEDTTTEAAEASAESTDRPDKDGDGTPDVQTFRGKRGDTFTLVGQPGYKEASKEAVKVTVLGTKGPFSGYDVSAGNQLIGITVRFEGAGEKVYDDPQPNGDLTVTGGETGEQTSLIALQGKNPCDSPSLKLKKGKSVTSCLAYEIPKGAKPQVFKYAASSGYGDTGIWRFR